MRARRVDNNHAQIAGWFERLGCLVHRTNLDWDLTVSRMKVVKLIECKNNAKAKHTERQVKLLSDGWPIQRVENLEDAIQVVEAMRAEAMKREGVRE
jgi:hypothetical protein